MLNDKEINRTYYIYKHNATAKRTIENNNELWTINSKEIGENKTLMSKKKPLRYKRSNHKKRTKKRMDTYNIKGTRHYNKYMTKN